MSTTAEPPLTPHHDPPRPATPSTTRVVPHSATGRVDLLTAAGVALLCLAVHWRYPLAAVLSVALVAPLAWRRTRPGPAVAVAVAVALTQLVLLDAPTTSLVTVLALVHATARWAGPILARTTLGLALAGAAVAPVRWMHAGGQHPTTRDLLSTVVAYAAVVLLAHAVGVAAWQRQQQQDLAHASARADERTRMAREVHDVVAHALSVISVQAEGGRAAASRHPEQAEQALAVISGIAHDALTEIRSLVETLRRGAPRDDELGAPVPGAGDLPGLVGRLGRRARLTVHGPAADLPAGVGLTVYRVVQEAVTNVVRHAGPDAVVDVAVRYRPQEVQVTVTDDGGTPAPRPAAAPGHGLVSMTERVELHGGSLRAAPAPGGGFVVHATIPLPVPAQDGPPR